MKRTSAKEIISSHKEKIYLEYLYQRNKHKGVTKEFINFLIEQKLTNVLKYLNESKNLDEFHNKITTNIDSIKTRLGYVFECLITGKIFKHYNVSLTFITKELAEAFIKNNYNKEDLLKIIDMYSNIFASYINQNNSLKHSLQPVEIVSGFPVIDFKPNINETTFKELCNLLFKPTNIKTDQNTTELSLFIVRILSLYDKETLFNNPEFVNYELQYGYFDTYVELLSSNKEIPSVEERLNLFNQEKNITSTQHYHLKDIDLLEERISSLQAKSKNLVLEKIRLAKEETNMSKKAKAIDECYEYYETTYRKEIPDSLFTPTSSIEVTDFRSVDTVMLHAFIRSPMNTLPKYREELKQSIINSRTKVTQEQELTEEEQQYYQSKIEYAINIALNPVITSISLDRDSIYSDATGLRWYKTNTSSQISTSIYSIEILMNINNCIGVGFDNTSFSPDNIIMTSKYYQTTNMGVDNLEISPEDKFSNLSSPLSELKKAKQNEVVLHRDNNGSKTNAAYVFAIINGRNIEQDKDTIEQAKKYAEDNNIKLVVFNNYKIRKSYEEFLNEQPREQQETSKKLK